MSEAGRGEADKEGPEGTPSAHGVVCSLALIAAVSGAGAGPSSGEHRAALYGFPDDVEDIEDEEEDDDGTLVRLSDVTADGRERHMLI